MDPRHIEDTIKDIKKDIARAKKEMGKSLDPARKRMLEEEVVMLEGQLRLQEMELENARREHF
ncbi:MAG: hypothetical protein JJU11_11715 [Candidatus Sumerlaeia bacterium]|nr:hypothetical protein [Candidatus Sumerlaeia bacterium]